MPTITKSWLFNTDTEGLVDDGLSTDITFQHQPIDGNPLAGCVNFNVPFPPLASSMETATGPFESWFLWGVPPGNTVGSVRIYSWRAKGAPGLNLVKCRIIAAGGISVSGGDLASRTTDNGAWQEYGPEALYAVSPAYTDINTSVALQLEGYAQAFLQTSALIDTIVLEITYEPTPVDDPCACGEGGSPIRPLSIRHPWLGSPRWQCTGCHTPPPPLLQIAQRLHPLMMRTEFWLPATPWSHTRENELPGYLLFMDSLEPTLYMDTVEATMEMDAADTGVVLIMESLEATLTMDSTEPTLKMDAQYK